MTLAPQQQAHILQNVNSHAVFVSAITGMLNWFQTAVAGYRAERDFDTEFEKLNATIAADTHMSARLINEWAAFARTARDAYGNFGRDVITRHGVDEPAQVRNLALNTIGGAFQQSRTRAREFLICQIEPAAGELATRR